MACEKRFTTCERFEHPELTVATRDGRSEDFDRDKLEGGILEACEKRPIPRVEIMRVIDEVEEELRACDACEVASSEIGEIVLEKSCVSWTMAYTRFASVYKQFGDASHFQKELKQLKQQKM